VTAAADPNANIIFGAVIDPSMGSEVRVTVIATGFGQRRRTRRQERQRGSVTEAPVARTASEGFEVSSDMLDVPSFLRDS
jgi:cell division protein FtsZ